MFKFISSCLPIRKEKKSVKQVISLELPYCNDYCALSLSLSLSLSTHGLVQLVRARNITTVGEMSSLSEKQVQSLPIKSPKVFTLRNALRSFEQQVSYCNSQGGGGGGGGSGPYQKVAGVCSGCCRERRNEPDWFYYISGIATETSWSCHRKLCSCSTSQQTLQTFSS